MSGAAPPSCRVCHLIARDYDAAGIERLRTLLSPQSGIAASVVHIGTGPAPELNGLIRLNSSLIEVGIGLGSLQRAIQELDGFRNERPRVVLHCWSPRAAGIGLMLLNCARRAGESSLAGAVVESGAAAGRPTPVSWPAKISNVDRIAVVCPTLAAQRRLVALRIAPGPCVTIAGCAPDRSPDPLDAGRAARAQLGLRPSDEVILVLPPVTRASGGMLAAWAALLVEKIRPNVRLIVPGGGREVARVRNLVSSCRVAHVLRTPGDGLDLAAMLGAADVATFLPSADAPVEYLYQAMAVGVPLLGSAVPAVSELLAHGATALLCRPAEPRDAARHLLATLEDRPSALRRAAAARELASRVFSQQRMLEQYQRLYASIFAGRTVSAPTSTPPVSA